MSVSDFDRILRSIERLLISMSLDPSILTVGENVSGTCQFSPVHSTQMRA